MDCFKVTAKCGHVGKNRYIEKSFYVKADNKKDAAKKVRWKPRVKHHKKDAILSVKEISFNDYKQGIEEMKNDEFFNIKNSTDQKEYNIQHYEYIILEQKKDNIKTRDNEYKLKKQKMLIKEKEKMIEEVIYG